MNECMNDNFIYTRFKNISITTENNLDQMVLFQDNWKQQHDRSSKTDKSSTNQFDNTLNAQVFVAISIQSSRRHKPRVKEVRTQTCPQHNC